jgi:hypothetical protein
MPLIKYLYSDNKGAGVRVNHGSYKTDQLKTTVCATDPLYVLLTAAASDAYCLLPVWNICGG